MTDVTMKVRAAEIRPGDFLRTVEADTVYGPRGGKYRWDGVRVDSRVVRAGWRDPSDHRKGFVVAPATGAAFVLPGNLADLVDATVERSAETEVVGMSDDDLLAVLENEATSRAARLAATAELDRRTR